MPQYDEETLNEHYGPIEGVSESMKSLPFAHPRIVYKDKLIEGDLYFDDGGKLLLIIYCPKCLHMLTIRESHKQMHWDGKNISVEPFTCTWEMDNEAPVARGVNLSSMNLCRWKVGIKDGKALDA